MEKLVHFSKVRTIRDEILMKLKNNYIKQANYELGKGKLSFQVSFKNVLNDVSSLDDELVKEATTEFLNVLKDNGYIILSSNYTENGYYAIQLKLGNDEPPKYVN